MPNDIAGASMHPIVIPSSRYDTEEKRKKHAEYQRKWREANAEKVNLIDRKARQKAKNDPVRSENMKRWIKADKKKPKTRKRRQLQKKRRYQKTQHAMNGYRRWSDYEVEMAFNRELTDTQIAAELGRSVQAVESARIRYADRAPIGWMPKA